MKPGLLVTIVAVTFAILVVVAVTHRISTYRRAFDTSSEGDSVALVTSRFGVPSHHEIQGQLWSRYASEACQSPCAQRLWWEHPILRGMEAWSAEFDSKGHLLNKYHWVSP